MKLRSLTALLLVFCLLIIGCGKTEEKKESLPSLPTDLAGTDIVYQSENYTIGKNSFVFMYLYNYYTSVEPYAPYYGLDASLPFDEQYYEEELSWKDYICSLTTANTYNCIVYAEKALDEGFEYDDLQTELDKRMESLQGQADILGLSFDDYISSYYGEITVDDIKAAFELQIYAYAYNDILISERLEEITEEDYNTYIEENADEITQTEPTKNVGHILISFDFYDTEAQAQQKAEEVYDLWKSGERSKESFEELSNTYNDDANCFYEDVKRGDMVTEFEDWIYDPSRVEGDSEIVKTTYGYHIMYFVGNGEEPWKEDAKTAILNEGMNEYTESLHEVYRNSIAENTKAIDFAPDIPPKSTQT